MLNNSRSDASGFTDEEKREQREPTPPPEAWAEIIGVPGEKRKTESSEHEGQLSPKRLRSASQKGPRTLEEELEAMEADHNSDKLRVVKIELKKVDLKKKKTKKVMFEDP